MIDLIRMQRIFLFIIVMGLDEAFRIDPPKGIREAVDGPGGD